MLNRIHLQKNGYKKYKNDQRSKAKYVFFLLLASKYALPIWQSPKKLDLQVKISFLKNTNRYLHPFQRYVQFLKSKMADAGGHLGFSRSKVMAVSKNFATNAYIGMIFLKSYLLLEMYLIMWF